LFALAADTGFLAVGVIDTVNAAVPVEPEAGQVIDERIGPRKVRNFPEHEWFSSPREPRMGWRTFRAAVCPCAALLLMIAAAHAAGEKPAHPSEFIFI